MAVQRFGDERDWFFERRFGLFLHFGLYSLGAWHEQDQMRRFIPRSEYAKGVHEFNPTRFSPDRILDLAEEVGMGYVCLTTKHHDGFCLWDTRCTDFGVMSTPYKRDLVGMMAEACHRRGIRFGVYYSVVDWHQPNYPNQGRHHEIPGPEEGDAPDFEKYMEFLKSQVKELCTNYGKISHFFWDMNVPEHRDPSINEMIRSLQPAAVINDRGFDEGDFGTPERDYQADQLRAVLRFEKPTEACNSIGTQSWGYRAEEDYYSDRYLMQSIDGTLARGGNYLLNVGPQGDGDIPARAVTILRRIGEWYHKIKESLEKAEPASELTENRSVWLTRKGKTLYVHLAQPPVSEAVILQPIDVLPQKAVLLNTGEPVETAVELLPAFWKTRKKFLRLRGLPVNRLSGEVMVVRLDFDRQLSSGTIDEAKEFRG